MNHADVPYWLRKFVLEVRKKDGSEYPQKRFTLLFAVSSVSLNRMKSISLYFVLKISLYSPLMIFVH